MYIEYLSSILKTLVSRAQKLYKKFKNAVKSKSLEISLNVVVLSHVTTI